jgi:hypothetical protein
MAKGLGIGAAIGALPSFMLMFAVDRASEYPDETPVSGWRLVVGFLALVAICAVVGALIAALACGTARAVRSVRRGSRHL